MFFVLAQNIMTRCEIKSGCLPPSSFSSAAPQPPLPCLAFASLVTLSFTSLCNLSTFSLSLRISSCSFLSSASLSKPISLFKE